MAKKQRNFRNKRGGNRKDDERPEYREGRAGREREEYTGRNDISWYSRNPNLLLAAGSFPYPYRPGMQLPLGTISIPGLTGSVNRSVTIPGVLAIDWMPSLGVSNTATDPASILAKELYSKVRQKYSGSLEADAPDFAVYLVCLDSIFSYLAWLKRIYRLLDVWTPENYQLPDGILASFGLSVKTINVLRENKTQFWQQINELVLQSRKFTCPAVMDYFNRHYWMSDNVYADDNAINAQFYVFNLIAVYKYAALPLADGSTNTGAGAQMVPLPTFADAGSGSPDVTNDDLYNFGLELIQALASWDDSYTISGYLMRAFEGAPVFIVDEQPALQPFTPIYEPEVLAQIENLRCVPGNIYSHLGFDNNSILSGFSVTQNPLTNAVVTNPNYTVGLSSSNVETSGVVTYAGWNLPPILSIRSMTPTVADSTVASRLQVVVLSDTVSDLEHTFKISCGTEVPVGMRLIDVVSQTQTLGGQYNGTYIEQTPVFFVDTQGTLVNSYINNMVNYLSRMFAIEQFDWHPFIFSTFARSMSGGHVSGTMNVIGDTHNITVIDQEDLKNLHKICIYSELNAFSA